MKRTMTIVLAAGLALSMTACEALDRVLQVNIFESFSALNSADIAAASADELLTMSGSDAFYESLAEDPEAEAQVLATLDAAKEDLAADSPEFQEITVLQASIVLETTPAADFVGNVAGALTTVMEESEDVDIEGLVEDLLPADVYGADGALDEEVFIEMIDALVAADLYFQQLGGAIGEGGYADGADVSAGDIAQQALVSAIVANIDPPAGYDTTGEYLYALLTDTSGSVAEPTDYAMPDMESGYLYNLLLAANIDLSGAAE